MSSVQVSYTGERRGDAQADEGEAMVRQLQQVGHSVDQRLSDARVQLFGRGQGLTGNAEFGDGPGEGLLVLENGRGAARGKSEEDGSEEDDDEEEELEGEVHCWEGCTAVSS